MATIRQNLEDVFLSKVIIVKRSLRKRNYVPNPSKSQMNHISGSKKSREWSCDKKILSHGTGQTHEPWISGN
jgi:hypothetical protein